MDAQSPQSAPARMSPLTASTAQIEELCRRYNVLSLDTFYVSNERQPDDLAFVVDFIDLPGGGRADAYLDLYVELEKLFGRRVQLVSARADMSPLMRQAIDRSRQRVFART